MSATSEEVELLEGEGRIVVFDEASASRRKYKKGRVTPTNSICILGGVEIEEAGGGELTVGGRPKRKEAGRRFLFQAPDRTRGTFEREIQKRVAPRALIWTDLFTSYQWLLAGCFYVHEKANHFRGEWVGKKSRPRTPLEPCGRASSGI